jgi:uncharacterized protein
LFILLFLRAKLTQYTFSPMKQADSRGISGWGQFGILIGLTGAGFIFGSIAALIVWTTMTHTSFMNMPTEMLKPQNIGALLVVQVVTTILAFFIPALAYAAICYRRQWNFLGFTGGANSRQIAAVVLLALVTLPLIGALSELNKAIPLPPAWKLRFDALEKDYSDQVSLIAQVKTWRQYFTSLFIIAVLPAIVEETLFRGALQNLLTRWTRQPWLAILVTAILFSAIHLSWYGFLARMVLGVVLGMLFYYGQSIWLNILAHFINNAVAVTLLFIAGRQGQKVDVNADEHFPIWAVVASVIFITGLLTWFIRSSPPPATNADDFNVNHRSNPFLNDFANDVE